jgi:hypothetical protein
MASPVFYQSPYLDPEPVGCGVAALGRDHDAGCGNKYLQNINELVK